MVWQTGVRDGRDPASPLWAVTCLFNPAGYRRRVRNYRWFRSCLTLPLITVELSFIGGFALTPNDAEVLVQLDQGDVLFQKERLLNIGFEHLPGSCRAVVWIDCDVVFGTPDWPARLLEALEHYQMVQPFSERYDLPPDVGPDGIASYTNPPDRLSLMAKIARDGLSAADFDTERPPLGKPAWGLVWAARREALDRHGLYDACIFTGGDVAIFCAGFGAMDGRFMRRRMNLASHRHYMEWAEPFYRTVGGRVGLLEGPLYHFWHGAIADRRYLACLEELQALGFDPSTDLALTPQKTWRWASDKPQLHAHVRDYFFARNEDAEAREENAASQTNP
jgi:hypothetical protein